jgi:hypothetical protein
MSENMLLAFREHAAQQVVLPDLDDIERRGASLRRRRQGWSAASAAVVVAALAWATVSTSQPKADQGPAQQDDAVADAEAFYGFGSRPELDPGTYTWQVSRGDPSRPSVLVDLPPRWHAWDLGPNRWLQPDPPRGGEGYAGLVVTDMDDVVDKPCRAGSGMKQVGHDPQDLVDALASMPRHTVVSGPRPDDRFGYPATYLRIRTLDVRCPGGQDFLLSSHNGRDLTIPSAGMGAMLDAWVVDIGSRPVLVLATFDPSSPAWLGDELREVADSVRFVQPEE